MWHATCDMGHVTRDTWHVQVGGGKPFLKISAPYHLLFGREGVLKIISQIISVLMTNWFLEQPWLHPVCSHIKLVIDQNFTGDVKVF